MELKKCLRLHRLSLSKTGFRQDSLCALHSHRSRNNAIFVLGKKMSPSWIASFFLLIFLPILLVPEGSGQLISMASREVRSRNCSVWSAWGPCIWTKTPTRRRTKDGLPVYRYQRYMDQLSENCREHWLFRFLKETFGTAINNAFHYLNRITKDTTPCGMCSYRQSCGYGPPKFCNYDPRKTNRNPLPLYVSEEVCTRRKGLKKRQNKACTVLASSLGNTCQVWPNKRVVLTNVPHWLRNILWKAEWINCVPYRNKSRNRNECKCCCIPYRPLKTSRPGVFMCVKMRNAPKLPLAPVLQFLRNEDD